MHLSLSKRNSVFCTYFYRESDDFLNENLDIFCDAELEMQHQRRPYCIILSVTPIFLTIDLIYSIFSNFRKVEKWSCGDELIEIVQEVSEKSNHPFRWSRIQHISNAHRQLETSIMVLLVIPRTRNPKSTYLRHLFRTIKPLYQLHTISNFIQTPNTSTSHFFFLTWICQIWFNLLSVNIHQNLTDLFTKWPIPVMPKPYIQNWCTYYLTKIAVELS